MALPWTRSNSSSSFLYWGSQAWMQYLRWGFMRTEWNRTFSSDPCWSFFLWCSPGYNCLSRLQMHTVGSHQLFTHQNSQVLLCSASLKESFSQSEHIPGTAPNHMQYLALGLVRIHWVLMGYLSSQIPLVSETSHTTVGPQTVLFARLHGRGAGCFPIIHTHFCGPAFCIVI